MAIKGFKNKELEDFFYYDERKGLKTEHIDRLGMILDAINSSHHPVDLKALYGHKFAQKKGAGKGVYSIVVNGNYRVTFQIKDDGAVLLDYLDYHGKNIKAQ
ncbi:MAG: proteic killer suppression protein [Paraglaciecola sp.]